MLKSVVVRPFALPAKVDAIIVPVFAGARTLSGNAIRVDKASKGVLTAALSDRAFAGNAGETLMAPTPGSRAAGAVLMVGMGPKSEFGARAAAIAGGAASRVLARRKQRSAAVVDDGIKNLDAFVHGFTKGFALGQYKFRVGAAPSSSGVRKLVIACEHERSALTRIARRALLIAEHEVIVRDLVNTPANIMTPDELAQQATALCRENGVSCTVLKRAQIEKAGLDAVMAVAKGSTLDPRFIVMQYNRSERDLPCVCLVGKGVTFDSGGISIKPWAKMEEMKGDMAGAAVVIASMAAAARLELPVRLIGIVPAVENMPDAGAFRPGDVINTYAGKSIEIYTTDAEGRLILSDGIAYGKSEFEPDVIVDYATLTGAVLIALGTRIAGVMGNSQRHIDAFVAAGNESGEPAWQLPLDHEFMEAVRGTISDFKNYSGREGSSITAGALLGHFAGNTPWLHVDIAGTFWSNAARGHFAKGATGYGVDVTMGFLEAIAEQDG